MKGTEKQVKWAPEIRANVIKTFADAASAEPQLKAAISPYIERISSDDIYAGDIIDLFSGIRFKGDLQHNVPEVMAVYRVATPSTDGQRAILGR